MRHRASGSDSSVAFKSPYISGSMSDNKGEGISEIDSHISRKYEIRRRIGKGVSTTSFFLLSCKLLCYQIACLKMSSFFPFLEKWRSFGYIVNGCALR